MGKFTKLHEKNLKQKTFKMTIYINYKVVKFFY